MAIYNTNISGGLNTKDCTADASKILDGYTAGVGKEIVTGTMVDNGDVSTTIVDGVLKEGYTSGGTIANLVSGNVKKGVSIGGIVGDYGGNIQMTNATLGSVYLDSSGDIATATCTSALSFVTFKDEYYNVHLIPNKDNPSDFKVLALVDSGKNSGVNNGDNKVAYSYSSGATYCHKYKGTVTVLNGMNLEICVSFDSTFTKIQFAYPMYQRLVGKTGGVFYQIVF